MPETVSPQELNSLYEKNPSLELIDVRTPVEFQEVHVKFAKNVPLDQLDVKSMIASRNEAAGQPLYLICNGGGRGKKMCEKFEAAGFSDVYNIEGGTKACIKDGLSVVRGKKAMSLERQVRIAAGFLVLLGAVLAATVHLNWIGLSGFVGAGLMFAGITDTCGMAMIIAKMPWNKVKNSCKTKFTN